MPIVSSIAAPGHAQANGSRYVRETHTWDDGAVTHIEYGPIRTDKVDLQAIADARAQRLVDETAARAQEQSERDAADAKLAAVLDSAVQAGSISGDELRKLGLPVPNDRTAR